MTKIETRLKNDSDPYFNEDQLLSAQNIVKENTLVKV